MSSRIERLNRALENLKGSSGEIEACAVVSEDGLIIASSLPQGVEEDRVAAMAAAMISIGTRISVELNRGGLEQLFVKGDQGYVLAMNAGPHAVLLSMARKGAKLGLLFLDMGRAAEEVREIIS